MGASWSRARPIVVPPGATCVMVRDGRVCGLPATTINHRRRRKDGGTDCLTNMEPACAECNSRDGGLSRSTKDPPAFLTPAQAAIVAALDAAGVPCEAGRRAAVRTVHERLGVQPAAWRSSDVDAACRWRRARGPADPPPSRW